MIEKNCQKLNEKNGVPKGKKSYNLSEIMAIRFFFKLCVKSKVRYKKAK